jgi:hypothetical protein
MADLTFYEIDEGLADVDRVVIKGGDHSFEASNWPPATVRSERSSPSDAYIVVPVDSPQHLILQGVDGIVASRFGFESSVADRHPLAARSPPSSVHRKKAMLRASI